MKYRVQIVCGCGFDKNGREIVANLASDGVTTIRSKAAALFGGSTCWTTDGNWLNDDGKLVDETGFVLQLDNLDVSRLPEARQFAATVRDALNQNSVVFVAHPVDVEFI